MPSGAPVGRSAIWRRRPSRNAAASSGSSPSALLERRHAAVRLEPADRGHQPGAGQPERRRERRAGGRGGWLLDDHRPAGTAACGHPRERQRRATELARHDLDVVVLHGRNRIGQEPGRRSRIAHRAPPPSHPRDHRRRARGALHPADPRVPRRPGPSPASRGRAGPRQRRPRRPRAAGQPSPTPGPRWWPKRARSVSSSVAKRPTSSSAGKVAHQPVAAGSPHCPIEGCVQVVGACGQPGALPLRLWTAVAKTG